MYLAFPSSSQYYRAELGIPEACEDFRSLLFPSVNFRWPGVVILGALISIGVGPIELRADPSVKKPNFPGLTWIIDRYEKPLQSDVVHGATLAVVNMGAYWATAIILDIPAGPATGMILYQGLVTGTETIYLRSFDNISQNRLAGGLPKFPKSIEFSIRLLRQFLIAEGFRWVSGPILGAHAVDTLQGQIEIFWNVAAFGAAHSLIAISRSRFLTHGAGQLANTVSFVVVGSLASLDIMGAHLFDVPYLSSIGIHGSNLLIWASGGVGAWFIWQFPDLINFANRKLNSTVHSVWQSCSKALAELQWEFRPQRRR